MGGNWLQTILFVLVLTTIVLSLTGNCEASIGVQSLSTTFLAVIDASVPWYQNLFQRFFVAINDFIQRLKGWVERTFGFS
jgi:hypothetical protein